jgi:hypothetical protein
MYSHRLACIAALIVCSLGSIRTAIAAAEGYTTHDSFTWTLVDLDLTDGIAPALEFLPLPPSGTPYGPARASVSSYVNGISQQTGMMATGTAPLNVSFGTSPYSVIGGRIDGRDDPETLRITLDIRAQANSYQSVAFGWLESDNLEFVLSPNTEITFHSVLRAHGGIDVGPAYDSFSTTGELHVYLYGIGEVFDRVVAGATPSPSDEPTFDVTRLLTVSYANHSTDSVSGNVMFSTVAEARAPALPVPEPGALPMAITGLAVVAWAARRRR